MHKLISLSLLLLPLLGTTTVFACETANVKFSTDFSTARMDECRVIDKDTIEITLKPENTPINNSAWYAFKVEAKKEQTISIVMKVEGGKHRYLPKVSFDGKRWQPIKYSGKRANRFIELNVSKRPVYLTGQEIINNQDYYTWGEKLASEHGLKHRVIGFTVQERPVYALEYTTGAKDWLVVLGRQHPPELTGALALFPFVESLFESNDTAKLFKQKFNILVVPNMNPDGVYMGNWRHNANGIDLNRDWKSLKQPETVAVDNYLKRVVASGGKVQYAVDFHSTHKEIFYTMPTDYGVEKPLLTENWLNDVDQATPNFSVIQRPGNNPDKGVFKQYIADKYKVHAITYEMGDNTDRQFIKKLAKIAADKLMKNLTSPDARHEK